MSFGDLYTVPAGQPQDPSLPAVDLPRVEAPPRRPPLRIEVRPDRPERMPYHDLPEYTEPEKPAAPRQAYHEMPEYQEPPPKQETSSREYTPLQSGALGARESMTFGAYPAYAGAMAAGTEGEKPKAVEPEPGAMDAIYGLISMGLEHYLSPEGKRAASDAYTRERKRALEEQEAAHEQNPGAYLGGQLAGALAVPTGAGLRAASAAGRYGRAAVAGGIGGGAYGAGGAISEGEGPLDVAKGTALGAGTGAIVGTAGHGLVEGAGALARRGRDLLEGVFRPEAVADRQLGEALREAQRTGTLGVAPGNQPLDILIRDRAARDAFPIYNIDVGGEPTRRLGRALSNVSHEAAEIIGEPLLERQAQRTERIVQKVQDQFTGALDAKADRIALKEAGRRANKPAYDAAYAAGDRPIGANNRELQDLMGSDAVKAAMKRAVTTGKDEAIADGYGAFNPGVSVTPDGRLVFDRVGRNGVPIYPNIQYWDYVQRALGDMVDDAGKGTARARTLGKLQRDLNAALDAEVPQFGAARQGAARFFGARDASEAGEKFILGNKDVREARRDIARLSPPERELFARGAADAITEALQNKPGWGTIDKLFTSGRARERIEAAMGAARAREIEVSLRAQTLARDTERAMFGNSTTARQISDIDRLIRGMAGHGAHTLGSGGLVAGYEALKEGDYNIKHMILTAALWNALRTGAHHVDARAVRILARNLVSDDPAIANRAMRATARSPTLFNALRRGTEAGSRILTHDVGPRGIGAGIAAAYNEIMKTEPPDKRQPHANQQDLQDQSTP